MTDNNIDEKLIASFFEAHQIGEIEDRGFSRRVMRRLPESRMRRLNTVWTLLCMVAVVVYFIMQQGTKVLLVALTHHRDRGTNDGFAVSVEHNAFAGILLLHHGHGHRRCGHRRTYIRAQQCQGE